MAQRKRTVCDFTASIVAGGEHSADTFSELRIGAVTFKIDICSADVPELTKAIMALGYVPTTAQVNKNARTAHVGASGLPFTTRDVREWLQGQGRQVSFNGRLGAEDIEAYRLTH